MVIEDLISTGKSSLQAVEALRENGSIVKGMVAIFTYGFDVATANFEAARVPLMTLSNYENLLNLAVAKHYISEDELATLRLWSQDTANWNQ